MPDHIHGIIIINKKDGNKGRNPGNDRKINTENRFGPQSQNLGSVIRGFKTGVTSYCKMNKILFGWQARYHDHIIRDPKEFNDIRNYIMDNPVNWRDDEL